jgi:hypothetical protein
LVREIVRLGREVIDNALPFERMSPDKHMDNAIGPLLALLDVSIQANDLPVSGVSSLHPLG